MNEIVIEIYRFNLDNEMLFYSIGSKHFFQLPNENIITGFSCESMFDEKEKRLTCFLGYINNIVSYSFNIDDASNIINNSSKIFSNNGAILLKTISNKKIDLDNWCYIKYESLVCFIDYYTEKGNCIKYNFQTNTFSEYIIYTSLNNCKSTSSNLFNIEKIEDSFFLYCFHSSREFSLIKLALNPPVGDLSRYKVYKIPSNSLIETNSNYYFSLIIYDEFNIYVLFNTDEPLSDMNPQEEESNTNIETNSINIESESAYNIDKIINDIKLGYSYYYNYGEYSINIYPINNNLIVQDKTNIELLECEKKLRHYYNLNDNNLLMIVQVEIVSKHFETLTNNVRFAIYDENKKKLDLSVCDGVNIRINYKIKKDEKILEDYRFYQSKYNIDIFNIKDPFFNDICFPFFDPESGEYMNLEDRIEKIYANYSICDNNCEYVKIDNQNNTASCICFSLLNIESKIEEPKFKQNTLTYLQDSEIGLLKCYNLFNKKVFKNFSFWILIILLIIRFFCILVILSLE